MTSKKDFREAQFSCVAVAVAVAVAVVVVVVVGGLAKIPSPCRDCHPILVATTNFIKDLRFWQGFWDLLGHVAGPSKWLGPLI